jgi:hypothetical protein
MTGNGNENRLTVEWAAFTLAPGVKEDDLLNASARLQDEFLSHQKGFIRRELLRGTDGKWADLVYWESAEDANAIVEAAFKSPVCLNYFKLMVAPEPDKPDGGVLHFERIHLYS